MSSVEHLRLQCVDVDAVVEMDAGCEGLLRLLNAHHRKAVQAVPASGLSGQQQGEHRQEAKGFAHGPRSFDAATPNLYAGRGRGRTQGPGCNRFRGVLGLSHEQNPPYRVFSALHLNASRSQIGGLARDLVDLHHGKTEERPSWIQRQPVLARWSAAFTPVSHDKAAIEQFVRDRGNRVGEPATPIDNPVFRTEKALALTRYGRTPDEVTEFLRARRG